MADEHQLFGEAYRELSARQDLGFGTLNNVAAKQRRVRYPDLLIIGAQKAGTTWLYANLNYHPNIWLAPVKELNYFNQVYAPSVDEWELRARREQAQAVREYFNSLPTLSPREELRLAALDVVEEEEVSDDWYGRIFAHAPAEDLCGEASPEYCVMPRGAVAHVASLNPAAQAILVLRDPIDRLWSHLRMAARNGYGDTNLSYLSKEHVWRIFAGRSNYPEMIRRWRNAFGEGRIIVLSYDRIISDPMGVLRTVCEHFGLYYDGRFFPRASTPRGVGQEAVIPEDVYTFARARLRNVYDDLAESLPEISESWRQRHYGN